MVKGIISYLNSNKRSKMSEGKPMDLTDKYRYDKLCEIVMNWDKFDSTADGSTNEEAAFHKLLNLFPDDSNRYAMVKPLLDEHYIENLENQKKECENLFDALAKAETAEGLPAKAFLSILERYIESGKEFSTLLKSTVNNQMGALLRK